MRYSLIWFGLLLPAMAGQAVGGHEETRPRSAFGWVEVEISLHIPLPKQHLGVAPGVVVEFRRDGEKGTSLMVANEAGVATGPLQPGRYCIRALGSDGKVIPLDLRQQPRLCFETSAGEWSEVGLVLAAGAEYRRDVPGASIH